jgi:hypothetical protein
MFLCLPASIRIPVYQCVAGIELVASSFLNCIWPSSERQRQNDHPQHGLCFGRIAEHGDLFKCRMPVIRPWFRLIENIGNLRRRCDDVRNAREHPVLVLSPCVL